MSVLRVRFLTPMDSGSGRQGMTPVGFPHSEILGSKFVSNSPRLIAADHVLHRLLAPRHSPFALTKLDQNRLDEVAEATSSNPRAFRALSDTPFARRRSDVSVIGACMKPSISCPNSASLANKESIRFSEIRHAVSWTRPTLLFRSPRFAPFGASGRSQIART
jgi:hypothetical protein